MTEIDASKPAGVSRRTVTKAMAWSVPAIAVAATAPAMAASPCVQFTLGPNSCKQAGNPFLYRINLCLTSTCVSAETPVVVTRIDTNANPNGLRTTPGGPTLVQATFTSATCQLLIGYSTNSAEELIISYTIGGVAQTPIEISAPPTQGGCTVEAAGTTRELAPTTDETAPTTDETAPTTEETVPTTEGTAPTTDETAPTTEESTPTP
jgi:hypothetical protein